MKAYLKMLPASNGDCLIIYFKDNENEKQILIDGGRGRPIYRILKDEIREISNRNQKIDLLVLSHTDEDHILGILNLFKDEQIDKSIFKNIWFNSGDRISKHLSLPSDSSKVIELDESGTQMSIRQGLTLENKLEEIKTWHKDLILCDKNFYINDMKISILSPDLDTMRGFWNAWEIEKSKHKEMSDERDYHYSVEELAEKKFEEDSSLPNRTSIAFLLDYEGFKFLMLADSHPSIVERSLRNLGYSETNKLEVDVVKVSHHGSKFNTSDSLLKIIDCTRFAVSTNGSNHGFPHKECLSRIIKSTNKKVTFYFNYSNSDIKGVFTDEEKGKYGINLCYLDEDFAYMLEV